MDTLKFNETSFEFRNWYYSPSDSSLPSYKIDCIVDGKLYERLDVNKYDSDRVIFENSNFKTTSDFGEEFFTFRNCVEFATYYFKQIKK